MKHGKPDHGYFKLRWKPDNCELPIFDPYQFLELVRGNSIAFIGDSKARNHMLSLGCLLSKVVVPEEDVSLLPEYRDDQNWMHKDYNFNVSIYLSRFLVRAEKPDFNLPTNLYVDEFDEHWTSNIERYHYIILSAGTWFFLPVKLYENGRLFACYGCWEYDVAKITFYVAYQKAIRTALRAIISLARSEAIIFLRTISVTHFEGGDWDTGGDCARTRHYKRNETVLEPRYSIMREIQLAELKPAQEEGNKKRLRIRLLDITQSTLLRPDGHPSKYGHDESTKNVRNDCLHYCLPGPADIWNELLLQLLLREESAAPKK